MRSLYERHGPSTRVWRVIGLAILALAMLALGPTAEAADKRPENGQCEWRNPAGDSYTGTIAAAVARHTDIPAPVRAKLAAVLSQPKEATDHVTITRDSVASKSGAYTLRDMNFGTGRVCWGEVTRNSWPADRTERALVFCVEGYCLARHSICRNVSRAYKRPPPLVSETPGGYLSEVPTALAPPDDWALTQQLEAPPFQLLPPPLALVPEPPAERVRWLGGPSWPTAWAMPPEALPLAPQGFTPPVPGSLAPPLGSLPDGMDISPVMPVSEPGVYAMLGLGLALVGWTARRRRAKT